MPAPSGPAKKAAWELPRSFSQWLTTCCGPPDLPAKAALVICALLGVRTVYQLVPAKSSHESGCFDTRFRGRGDAMVGETSLAVFTRKCAESARFRSQYENPAGISVLS